LGYNINVARFDEKSTFPAYKEFGGLVFFGASSNLAAKV
jgi:hypothetical protein